VDIGEPKIKLYSPLKHLVKQTARPHSHVLEIVATRQSSADIHSVLELRIATHPTVEQ
jgi:hypothetical protein